MFGLLKRTLLKGSLALLPFILCSCAWLEDTFNVDGNRIGAAQGTQAETTVLEPTKFKILLIDTPRVKFYDFASLKHNRSGKKLTIELYKLGKPVSTITISQKDVCMGKECTSKWIAAKGFFGDVSYPNLFSDILNARDIFDGEGKRVTNDGVFVQWFVRGGQEFYYERSKNRVLFKNLTSNITIGVEDYIIPKTQ